MFAAPAPVPPTYWVCIVPHYRNPAVYTLHVLNGQDEYEGFREEHPRALMHHQDSLSVSHSLLDTYASLDSLTSDMDDEFGPSLIVHDGLRRQMKELEAKIVPIIKMRNAAYRRRHALLATYTRA